MKKFFLSVLSSFVGAWLAIVLSGAVIIIVILAILGSTATQQMSVAQDSVLKIDLNGEITERGSAGDVNMSTLMSGEIKTAQTLDVLLDAISEAKHNPNIKAIYINCEYVAASPATLNTLRNALNEFKQSGKKIYAYADNMTQGAYFTVCNADYIYLNPEGALELCGLGGYTPYYKGLLDKLGVEFQVVKVGEGKSAVEPYILNTMSPYARNKHEELFSSMWDVIKQDISAAKGINTEKIDSLINDFHIRFQPAEFALKENLVDELCYRHKAEENISAELNMEGRLTNTVAPSLLAEMYRANERMNYQADQVAVLYACGGIDDAMSSGIKSNELVSQILTLADDDNVKGLVLRVNSPGGSAFGSEQIWEALETFKATGKPFAVSMGDYAASGGYYISCGAQKIFADRLTITGSIGIFGLIPNLDNLLTDKLGVNFELVATNPKAMYPSGVKPMTAEQTEVMQKMVERGYELFVKRCAEGRNISIDELKKIADGSAIDAVNAKELGLIDEFGSVDTAVKWVANQAKLQEYSVCDYPEITPTIWDYVGMFSDESYTNIIEKIKNSSIETKFYKVIMSLINGDKVYAKMPEMLIEL